MENLEHGKRQKQEAHFKFVRTERILLKLILSKICGQEMNWPQDSVLWCFMQAFVMMTITIQVTYVIPGNLFNHISTCQQLKEILARSHTKQT